MHFSDIVLTWDWEHPERHITSMVENNLETFRVVAWYSLSLGPNVQHAQVRVDREQAMLGMWVHKPCTNLKGTHIVTALLQLVLNYISSFVGHLQSNQVTPLASFPKIRVQPAGPNLMPVAATTPSQSSKPRKPKWFDAQEASIKPAELASWIWHSTVSRSAASRKAGNGCIQYKCHLQFPGCQVLGKRSGCNRR